MEKLTLKDIVPLPEYEKIRDSFKKRVIQLKEYRRIHLGDLITLVFENRETAKLQIEEMMRVERIYSEEKIQNEIDIYNSLIPDPNELSATLFIEIIEESKIRPQLDRLRGLDKGKSLYLEMGPEKIYALFEEGHSDETKISAVHYIRFRFSPEAIQTFRKGETEISLAIDHPNYQAMVKLSDQTRRTLATDF